MCEGVCVGVCGMCEGMRYVWNVYMIVYCVCVRV